MKPRKSDTGAVMRKKSGVMIYIDTIDDIFSDFDPRTIDARILSMDFLNEVRLQAQQSTDESRIDIHILAPSFIRKQEMSRKVEQITRRRILTHFQDEYRRIRSDRMKTVARALFFLISGVTCFFVIKLVGDVGDRHFFLKMLLELLTFFSWFATWSGIDLFSDLPKKRDVRLRGRLAGAQVQFRSVRDISAISPV